MAPVANGAPPAATDPEVTVAVAAAGSPLRLRWLLNALEDQEVAPERFEIVIGQAGLPSALVRDHPLVSRGAVRFAAARSSSKAAALEAAWRAARAPLVAFADEDCRPVPNWLGRVLAAARADPGAILAGALGSDPLDEAYLHSPLHRTRRVEASARLRPLAATVFPRELLESIGGLDRAAPGSDVAEIDLPLRARAVGAAGVAHAEIELFDAVRPRGPVRAARDTLGLYHLPWAVRRHPELREELVLHTAWRRSHVALVAGLAGIALARARPAAAALALPWALGALRGARPAKAPVRLVARGGRDLTEIAVLAAGSLRHRAVVL